MKQGSTSCRRNPARCASCFCVFRSLVNIKIRDVDFDNGVVYVNTTKNRKPLIIPLNEDIVKILQEYLQYRGGVADD